MKELKEMYKKAADFVTTIDKDKIEKFAEDSRQTIQTKLKDLGVDEKIEVVKKESSIIGDSISKSAQEVYKENEELLEKPVAKVTEVFSVIAKHSEKIKWAGAITAGVIAPVPTLVASSLFYLLSSDEEKENMKNSEDKRQINGVDEQELISSTAELMSKKEALPEKVITKNEYVEVTINIKQNSASGIIIKGGLKGSSFHELGIENMKNLADKLPKGDADIDGKAEEARTLINYWIGWKKSN